MPEVHRCAGIWVVGRCCMLNFNTAVGIGGMMGKNENVLLMFVLFSFSFLERGIACPGN